MARVLILGGGFGGVATAVTLRRLVGQAVEIVVVSQRSHFMVGFRKTWAMLEIEPLSDGLPPLSRLESRGIKFIQGTVESIDPAGRAAVIDGQRMAADALVVALGVRHAPEKVSGFAEHALNAYAVEGMERVTQALRDFQGGHIVTGIFGLPYQCPPAPYEVAILTKEYFQRREIEVQITVLSPKPMTLPTAGLEASRRIEQRLADFDIRFLPNMPVTAVKSKAVVCGDIQLDCDMALGIPPHIVVDVVRDSPLVAADGWIHADRRTLETGFDGVYAAGDCVKIPMGAKGRIPMAGLIAEKEGQVIAKRIAAHLLGEEQSAVLDGQAACYLEAGRGEAAVISGDFLAEPKPDVTMSDFSAAEFANKHFFEQSRFETWFDWPERWPK